MKEVKVGEIIDFLQRMDIKYNFEGELEQNIKGFASLNNYIEGCITWIRDGSVDFDKTKQIALCVAPYGITLKYANSMIYAENSKMVFLKF